MKVISPRAKVDTVKKSIRKKTVIDKSVKIQKILPDVEDSIPHICTCCGKSYKRQNNNFPSTKSPLFASNNGYVTVCKNCTDKYYYQVVDFFSGNEEKAIERICGLYDWFYDEYAVAASRRISADRSRIGAYPAKLNLRQSADSGSTFLDYIKLKANEAIDTYERLEEVKQNDPASISDRTVKKWGLGYTPEEYDLLNSHYKTLKDQASDDLVTENLIRELCTIKVQQSRSLILGEVDKYVKLTDLYQRTLGNANLKPKNNKETELSAQSDMFGTWARDIEKYAPADFFSDKKIYKDYDGLGDYFNRFIVRPFKNLITGSKEMDSEFSIQGDQSGDDADGGA